MTTAEVVYCMTLIKGNERYVFRYAESDRPAILRAIGRMASDPELSLTWLDAAVLAKKIRDTSQAAAARERGVW
jgi:hypothetical protein